MREGRAWLWVFVGGLLLLILDMAYYWVWF
jgi:hypothetical protein